MSFDPGQDVRIGRAAPSPECFAQSTFVYGVGSEALWGGVSPTPKRSGMQCRRDLKSSVRPLYPLAIARRLTDQICGPGVLFPGETARHDRENVDGLVEVSWMGLQEAPGARKWIARRLRRNRAGLSGAEDRYMPNLYPTPLMLIT